MVNIQEGKPHLDLYFGHQMGFMCVCETNGLNVRQFIRLRQQHFEVSAVGATMGFTAVPNKLARCEDLNAYEFRVLVYIMSYDPAFPSYSTMAKHLNISRPTLIRAVKSLSKKGLLTYVKGNSFKKANEYKINVDKYVDKSGQLVNDVYRTSKRRLPVLVNDVYSKNPNPRIIIKKEKTSFQLDVEKEIQRQKSAESKMTITSELIKQMRQKNRI